MRSPRRRVLGLVATLAVVAAACGGGDDPAVVARSPAAPPDAAAPEATGPGAPASSDSPDTVPAAWEWTTRAAAPRPLTEVAAAAFGGAVWVAGGYAADGAPVADVQIYDPTSDTWSAGPPLPEAVHHAALVSTGDRLLLIGGYTGRELGGATSAVHVLDAAVGAWVPGPPLPEPRGAGAAAYDGERVVYGGGVGPDGLSDDVWSLDEDRWVRTGVLAAPREHLAAASDGDGRVFLLGGRTGGLDQNLGSVDLVEADTVTSLGTVLTPRGGLAGFYAPAVGACAAGGEGPSGTFADVECVDASGEVTRLGDLVLPRHGLGAAVADGIVYVALGGPEPGLTVSPDLQALPLGQTP